MYFDTEKISMTFMAFDTEKISMTSGAAGVLPSKTRGGRLRARSLNRSLPEATARESRARSLAMGGVVVA